MNAHNKGVSKKYNENIQPQQPKVNSAFDTIQGGLWQKIKKYKKVSIGKKKMITGEAKNKYMEQSCRNCKNEKPIIAVYPCYYCWSTWNGEHPYFVPKDETVKNDETVK